VRSPQFGERWLSVNAVPVPAAVGAAAGGVVATFVDITERRALDMQLAETGRQLQDLYDCSPCGHHSLDADGRFLRINHTGLAWLECTREELLGRRITDFFTPEGRATFARNFPRLKTEGRLDGLEFDLVSARGTVRRVRVAATAITDADGRFRMSRSVMFDISDLHRTRQALEALSREQSAMLDSDLVGLVKVRQRHFTWVSAGAARILGYAADELHGQSTRVVYADPADHDALPAALGPDRRVGQRFRGQFRARRKDGTIVWIDLSSALLPQADGESLGLIVDITSLKAAEAHHLKLREVEAENLRLCEVGRMKDEFLAQMSHELRTPLNAVMGFTHLLQSGAAAPDSARFAGYLAKVDEGGKRLLQLVDTLLDYAKAEAGRIDFRPEPVDVAGVVQGVIEMLQESAARRQVVIAFAAGDVPPPATELDPLRLRQVLRDLIGNAVKFSHDGGRVEVRLQADGEQRLRIEIEDHGIGIAEADLPRLFKRFEQLSSGMARTAEGAGLGLALAKRLVEAQGGTVAVQSRFGAGSVFTVVLPCLPAPPAAPLPV